MEGAAMSDDRLFGFPEGIKGQIALDAPEAASQSECVSRGHVTPLDHGPNWQCDVCTRVAQRWYARHGR